MSLSAATQQRIESQLDKHPIVLYMKGTPDFPQCGFSHQVASILQACKAKFFAINVLDDPEIWKGIKIYSEWPTIPQLYIHKTLIGGCDIVTELYEKGELIKQLDKLPKEE